MEIKIQDLTLGFLKIKNDLGNWRYSLHPLKILSSEKLTLLFKRLGS
jgi:hypothetical protein